MLFYLPRPPGHAELYFLAFSLSQAVEHLCVHKYAEEAYKRLQRVCDAHIGNCLRALTGQSPDPAVFLTLMRSCWQDHCEQMLLIRSIALSLDRTVVNVQGLVPLWDMGLNLFRLHLEALPELEHKSVDGLLRLIDQER